MNRRKIAWITPDCFQDVDMPILPFVNSCFDLTWYVVTPHVVNRFNENDTKLYAQKNKIKLQHLRPKGRQRGPGYLKADWLLYRELLSNSYDIVYTEYINMYFILLLLLHKPHTILIFGIHDVEDHSDILKNKIQYYLAKLVRTRFDKYQVFSTSQANLFKKKYDKKAEVIELSLKDYGPSKVERPSKNDNAKFLFFGNIESYKNLGLLIDSCETLVKKGYFNFTLTIAGKGSNWNDCRRKIISTRNYDLRIGFFPNEDIPDLFASHHFLILPYKDVTQSGPLLIAYKYALPLIVSDNEGFLEFVKDGRTGLVFQKDKVNHLADKLINAIEMDEMTYGNMVSCVEQQAGNYDGKHIAAKYVNYFSKL